MKKKIGIKINVNYKNQILTKESLSRNKFLAKFLVVYFFKSKLSPIISFLLPLLFMMVFYVAASGSDDPDAGLQLFLGSLATYISLSILPLALISMPQIIVELKNSIILRRIKNSGFTKNNFLALTFILHFLLSIAFVLIVFGLFFVFFFTMKDPNGVREQELSNINIGGLIYSILLLIVSSLSVGIFLSSVIKNVSYALISGIIVILVTITFAGQFIPIQVIGGTEAFRYISLFSPLTYAAGLLNTVLIEPAPVAGVTPDEIQNIFNFSHDFVIGGFSGGGELTTVYKTWQKALNVFMPIIVSIGFGVFSVRYFKWFGR